MYQLKTGFIILQTAAKKLQLTICVLQKRSIIYFIRQKINNTLNTFFIRLVSLNAGKENLTRLIKKAGKELNRGKYGKTQYKAGKWNVLLWNLTDEERTTITNRINEGYYRPEAVQARKDEEKRKAYEKKSAEIIKRLQKETTKGRKWKASYAGPFLMPGYQFVMWYITIIMITRLEF